MEELQERIGIAFRDTTLLQEALTHSSFANESPQLSPRDNERLEYLGDAVLQLITAEYLYKYRPDANEGELTQTRSAMVNTNTLAALSDELGIGEHLYLGKGIAKGGGRSLKSLLANAFEAVLGGIFLDAGYDAAYHFYLDRFRRLPEPVRDENHKGRLQQLVQERLNLTPVYDSAGSRSGNRREYTAVVFAGPESLGSGHGHTKQEAEQDAARAAIAKLLGLEPAPVEPPIRTEPRRRRRRGAGPTAAEVAIPESPLADVTPSEVDEVLAAEEAPGLQPPPSGEVAEPVAQTSVGGPEPVEAAPAEAAAPEAKPRTRRRSSRRKEARPAEGAQPASATESQPGTEAAAATEPAASEPPGQPEPPQPARRTRSRRRSTRKSEEKPAGTEPAAAAEPAGTEPPRSRQFGEPLE